MFWGFVFLIGFWRVQTSLHTSSRLSILWDDAVLVLRCTTSGKSAEQVPLHMTQMLTKKKKPRG